MNGSALRILFFCFVLLNICSCTIQFFIYDVVSLFIRIHCCRVPECVSGTSINWLAFYSGRDGHRWHWSHRILFCYDFIWYSSYAQLCTRQIDLFCFHLFRTLFLAVAFKSIVFFLYCEFGFPCRVCERIQTDIAPHFFFNDHAYFAIQEKKETIDFCLLQ